MVVKHARKSDKWMLLLFPLITLSLFLVGIVLYTYLPQLVDALIKRTNLLF